MAKHTPGIFLRGKTWHIDKTVFGRQIRGSTGTGNLDEAEVILAGRIEQIKREVLYWQRRKRTWREAVERYVSEHQDKKSVNRDFVTLKKMIFAGSDTIGGYHLG